MKKRGKAYFSVSDKTGVVEFAFQLSKLGYSILASGGTASILKQNELAIEEIPLGDPRLLAAFSADPRPGAPEEESGALEESRIEIAVVNLYPMSEILKDGQTTQQEAFEFLDVHAISILRGAAKNFQKTLALCDPDDYASVLEALETSDDVAPEKRRHLAAKAFHYVAYYDSTVAQYLSVESGMGGLSDDMVIGLKKVTDLRYGENPHQQAALYRLSGSRPWGLAAATLLHGKALNFEHLVNLEAANELVAEFQQPACAIIKHSHPTGIAQSDNLGEAARLAYAADPAGCIGATAALNREINEKTAKLLAPLSLECIAAVNFSPEALDVLRQKRDVRLVALPSMLLSPNEIDFRPISGGILIQDKDNRTFLGELKSVGKRAPDLSEMMALEFAWKIAKHCKTHAAVLARGLASIGIGCGQSSRMDAVRLAIVKGQERHPIVPPGVPLVLAADGPLSVKHILESAEAGVVAVIESGGSSEDPESIEACDAKGLAMVFTGVRHFRH